MPRNSEILTRTYIVTLLATFFLGSACIVLFCFLVNPYKIFPAIPQLSPVTSPNIFPYLRLYTPYEVEQVRPSVLIAGNSRSSALPPQAFQREGEAGYNASLPGAKLEEIRRIVEHAHAGNPLQLVVIGLDQIMFRKNALDDEAIKGLDRYRRTNTSVTDKARFLYRRIDDYYRSLFSLTAMTDAWLTLLSGYRTDVDIQDDGTWTLENANIPRMKLYRKLATKIYRTQITEQSEGIEFGELISILDFTEAHGIQTILLISPMQGLVLNAIALAGAWDQYTNWQRKLVHVATQRPNTAVYGVEDKPLLILEPIEASQPLFRDGVHYTSKAASKVAECLNGHCDESVRPTRLNNQTISPYLEQLGALREQYARNHPAEIARLKKWIVEEKNNPSDDDSS